MVTAKHGLDNTLYVQLVAATRFGWLSFKWHGLSSQLARTVVDLSS